MTETSPVKRRRREGNSMYKVPELSSAWELEKKYISDLARAFWLRERMACDRRWYGVETTGRNLDFIPIIVYIPGISIC